MRRTFSRCSKWTRLLSEAVLMFSQRYTWQTSEDERTQRYRVCADMLLSQPATITSHHHKTLPLHHTSPNLTRTSNLKSIVLLDLQTPQYRTRQRRVYTHPSPKPSLTGAKWMLSKQSQDLSGIRKGCVVECIVGGLME